jgi:hypothetical protein
MNEFAAPTRRMIGISFSLELTLILIFIPIRSKEARVESGYYSQFLSSGSNE